MGAFGAYDNALCFCILNNLGGYAVGQVCRNFGIVCRTDNLVIIDGRIERSKGYSVKFYIGYSCIYWIADNRIQSRFICKDNTVNLLSAVVIDGNGRRKVADCRLFNGYNITFISRCIVFLPL